MHELPLILFKTMKHVVKNTLIAFKKSASFVSVCDNLQNLKYLACKPDMCEKINKGNVGCGSAQLSLYTTFLIFLMA